MAGLFGGGKSESAPLVMPEAKPTSQSAEETAAERQRRAAASTNAADGLLEGDSLMAEQKKQNAASKLLGA